MVAYRDGGGEGPSVGTVAPTQPQPSTNPLANAKCGILWALFFIDIAFSLLGIYGFQISPDTIGIEAAYNVLTTWQWGFALGAITQHFWDFAMVMFQLTWFLLQNVVLPKLAWYLVPGLVAEETFKLGTPLGLALALAGVAFAIYVGYEALVAEGCAS